MNSVTAVERKVLDAIEAYIEAHGFSPTYRDLMRATSHSSPAPIQGAIYRLQAKGRVTFLPNQPRTLRVVKPA